VRARRRNFLPNFPQLSRFYGLSFYELVRMPRWAVRMYVDAMEPLQALEQLQAIDAASSPYMSPGSRRSMISDLERKIPKGDLQKKTHSSGDLDDDPVDVETWRAGLEAVGIKVELPDA
jgi:hypothetical protein